MGKAQSKRSVDITTETTKKGPEGGDEVTGKLEKIEDIDAKQVNGDATPQEKNDAAGEKKDAPDETENEKDLTTEKAAAESTATPSPTDGAGDQINANATESSPKEDAAAAAAGATTPPAPAQEGGEEITPLADESLNKKAKKEKPKKKWSFRSISFGKKDKQKPVKNEGSENAAENAAAATNGETTETNKPADSAAAEATKNEADEAKPIEKPEEKVENGVATENEQQMNGQKTPTTTPTDDAESKKPIEMSTSVAVNETATAVATNAATASTPATGPAPAPAASPLPQAAAPSSNETAKDSHVEKIEAVVSNGTADAVKNGDVHADDETEAENKTAAQTEDIKSAIPPAVDEKPHQNGTNGDEGVEEITAATKTLQIEVKTEHEFDSVKSTITTTSISNTTTTTTTTIIPDDNLNSEQKTSNDNNFITFAQTDTNTTTNANANANTSDKSLTSNNSIAKTDEEQSSVRPEINVLDNVGDDSTQAILETTETESGDFDAIPPPPLPLSAPPSQVVIFALKDNENDGSAISAIETEQSESPLNQTKSLEENIEENVTESYKEIPIIEIESLIDEPIKVEDEFLEKLAEKFAEPTKPIITEEIEIIEIITPVNAASFNDNAKEDVNEQQQQEDEEEEEEKEKEKETEEQTQQPIGVMDDFAVEALIIVDQIQKDLEKEDDDSQQPIDSDSERSLNDVNDIADTTENLSNVIESKIQDIEEEEEEAAPVIVSTIAENLIEVISSAKENVDFDVNRSVTIITTISNSEMIETQEQDMAALDSALLKLSISNDKSLHEIESQIEQEIEAPKHNQLSFQFNADDHVDVDDVDEEEQNCNQENDKSIQRNENDVIETVKELAESETESNNKEDCKNEINEPLKTIITTTTTTTYSSDIIAEDKTTMMAMMMISDDKDDEFIVSSSNKEIPSAKDLKENAAAAEITTQDLPVTCE